MPSRDVMKKFAKGKLHSGSKSGKRVTSKKQALAIMYSEKRKEHAHHGKYPHARGSKGKGRNR